MARRNLSEYSARDLLIVGLPLLLILIAGFWAASRFIRPAPPDTLTISSGGGAPTSVSQSTTGTSWPATVSGSSRSLPVVPSIT